MKKLHIFEKRGQHMTACFQHKETRATKKNKKSNYLDYRNSNNISIIMHFSRKVEKLSDKAKFQTEK